MKELAGCKAEVVFVHLNHTNPLLAKDSPERASVLAAGFKVIASSGAVLDFLCPFDEVHGSRRCIF